MAERMSIKERVRALCADPRHRAILAHELVLVVWPGGNFLFVSGEALLRRVLTTGISAESSVGIIRVSTEFEGLELRRAFDALRADTASVPSAASGD